MSSIAREGGLQSTLWAGPESISRTMRSGEQPIQGTKRNQPVALRLGFSGDDYGYLIDMGLPTPNASAFSLDPQIKRECIWHGDVLRPSTVLVDRDGPLVRVRAENNSWNMVTDRLSAFDSMMTHISDPRNAPEVLALREAIRDWRFYDHFRTDADAPVRSPQVGTWTPILGHDGANLASAVETIVELGEGDPLNVAVKDAFPGSHLSVGATDGRFIVTMTQHGLLRPLGAAELSDGTLRYLLLTAALLTPRPPALMVLNEPETSLHPDLLPALARLIIKASERTQMIVVTHAKSLISAMAKESASCHSVLLEKSFGETKIVDLDKFSVPAWHWPPR